MSGKRRAAGVARLAALVLLAAAAASHPGAAGEARGASDEGDVRATVERAFGQLRSGDFAGLYDALPTASRRRISRANFVSSLERARGLYELDRLEIGAVRVAGDLAVVDSTVYGRTLAPMKADGKIVLRQYLVREGGRWRVTTGDASTVRPLLAANPAFARKYPLTIPRLYVRRDGRWVEMGRERQPARRQTKRKD
jgi:hypothetical protein